MDNRFKFMSDCPLAGNNDWPVCFSSEDTIVLIIDTYILKKFLIQNNELIEVFTLTEWDGINQLPHYTAPAPEFYMKGDTVFTKNMVMHLIPPCKKCTRHIFGHNNYDNNHIEYYPLNFETESL